MTTLRRIEALGAPTPRPASPWTPAERLIRWLGGADVREPLPPIRVRRHLVGAHVTLQGLVWFLWRNRAYIAVSVIATGFVLVEWGVPAVHAVLALRRAR